MDVGRLVARSMRKYRDRVALEGPEGESTYGRTGARVMQLARGLRGLGLETGDRVLDLQTNQNTYIETDFGISTAGLCRVALNYRLHPTDWVRITTDCTPKVLILDVMGIQGKVLNTNVSSPISHLNHCYSPSIPMPSSHLITPVEPRETPKVQSEPTATGWRVYTILSRISWARYRAKTAPGSMLDRSPTPVDYLCCRISHLVRNKSFNPNLTPIFLLMRLRIAVALQRRWCPQ